MVPINLGLGLAFSEVLKADNVVRQAPPKQPVCVLQAVQHLLSCTLLLLHLITISFMFPLRQNNDFLLLSELFQQRLRRRRRFEIYELSARWR